MDGWIDRCMRGRAGDMIACDGGKAAAGRESGCVN